MSGLGMGETGDDSGFRGRCSSTLQAVHLLQGESPSALPRNLKALARQHTQRRSCSIALQILAVDTMWQASVVLGVGRCSPAWHHSVESNPFMAVEHPVDLHPRVCYKVSDCMGDP